VPRLSGEILVGRNDLEQDSFFISRNRAAFISPGSIRHCDKNGKLRNQKKNGRKVVQEIWNIGNTD
jgi:hypothetical protein